ncbi:ClpX C4-type zinc finger protein [Nocardioides mangrovi]|uniref:ClpX C4-type zinc finger protein n=1 Tax=Nocardioides mangrovi TaxID=2874580 RepID=A0ABS7UA82_9ACTN|nr:ClpX C4-type zinc finger protein [Nocardioides mangrovi]MBZ5737899.1 ClpX C4-type zinc finger protein [Nocardioides mangrovi]
MDQDPTSKHCSFCGETGSYDPPLCGGLGAFICGDCIDDNARGLADFQATGIVEPKPWADMSETHLLSRLWLIAGTVTQAEDFLRDWVHMIRGRGVSWTEIGKALGISAQAARARFGSAPARA